MRAFKTFLILATAVAMVASLAIMKPGARVLVQRHEDHEMMKLLEIDLAEKAAHDLVQLQFFDEASKRAPSGSGSCSVNGYTSECCGTLSFRVLWQQVNLDACVLGEVIPDEHGVHMKLTVLGRTIIDETVSAHDPPPICVFVPKVPVASICVDLSNLQWENNDYRGCVALLAKVVGGTVLTVDLGCFDI